MESGLCQWVRRGEGGVREDTGGFMGGIGIRENLTGCDFRGSFIPVSKTENIYVKK